MTAEVSSSSSSQTTCATTSSITYTSTGGDTQNTLGAPDSKQMTSMTSHSVPASSFPPPPLGGNNLLATFMTNLFAANLMANRTVPVTQVPAMQAMGTQIPSSVQPSAPVMLAGSSLPVPGIQPVVSTSGFANLLASYLLANLAAGTGMTVPTPYPNAANNLNLLTTSTNPQREPSMPELIKEAVNHSNMYSINAPVSTLVPGALSVATQDSSLDSASKQTCTATSGSKTNRLSNYDNLYSSEAESTISCVSQRSNISKSSGSTGTSKKSSKQRHGTQKRKKSQFFRYDSENGESDIEICSSISSVSTADLFTKERRCNNSSPLSTAGSFAGRAIRMCCDKCAYKTKKRHYFENHLAGHLNNKQPPVDPKLWQPVRQKCGFCNYQTYLDEEFEEHVAMHMIKKPFQCSYCSFSRFTQASIHRHLSRVHPELEQKVKKNQNVRLKQTMLHNPVTKVSLDAVVKLRDVSSLNNKAFKRLCNKYQLMELNLEEN